MIITVEDEDQIREDLKFILSSEGFEVEGFSTPDSFIKYVRENGTSSIDLLILDIMMPGMTGIELIESISKEMNFKKIPVLFLSALGEESVIIEAHSAAEKTLTVDYIVKPFQVGWLLSRIRTLLTLKKSIEQLNIANGEILQINLEIEELLKVKEFSNEYLMDKLRKIHDKSGNTIKEYIQIVRDIIPKIAVNDLASLKFVAGILERNKPIIDQIIKEASEDEQFFKILTKTIEPLRTAIWDIEQSILLFISIGLISHDSIDKIDMEKTAFFEIIDTIYKDGGFSSEMFEKFLDEGKFRYNNSEVILF